MKAEALFWQQCSQAVTADGSVDAQRLMELVIATYRVHESDYDEIERSAETLLRDNHALRGNMSALRQAFDGQQRLFEIILNNLPLGLSVFDADQRLTLSNIRFSQLFGLTQADVTPGVTIADLIDKMRGAEGASAKPGRRAGRHSSAAVKSSGIRRREWLMDDGRVIQSMVTILADGSNIAIHADITEDRKAAERITYLAHHDPLTGLPNRIHFRQQVDAALAERKPDEQIALIHLNLDRFKSINNLMGVSAGDTILQQVAARIRASAGSENTLARLGSDEFAILQTGRQQPWNVTALAEQIRRELSEPFLHGEKQMELSVSMGIAVAPGDGDETDILLKHAGVALSHAKSDGRKRERFFAGEMEAQMQLRHALEADLRAAIEKEEFELHYQPLYDLSQRRICGFEALIRWNHPIRGRVAPIDFIPFAEEVGLIVDIGRWVLRRACSDAAEWPEDIKVAVNVSATQFSSSDLTRDVGEALATASLSPLRLELEITESVLMENLGEVLPILHALKERGIRISMDDFGTGYSSLSYLSSFPFDKIKIDKSFVNDIVDNKEAHAIMHAIILLGDALGMRVTVEGVETAEQLALLECEECDEIQGYHISRPRPALDVPHLLSLPRNGGATPLPSH
ncbi:MULTISPECIES: putative bifunctional diguanylate cyclase/phosphodiesterase [Rhizobium]|uniref:putative bifunctional diguanylate cyclase/phosphodiesterase n=1 Tax=Rhizobium TaxID=379 RepID=UPI000BE7A44E|nr:MULTISPECIES: EAL domain-containing protein [Rhizobium]MBY4589952.1 EAL domain-containing protein [Rhizobium redzepovicii]MBY4614224.1 EAL domain-containing protein [Rhizobium redzepovicii]MDF0661260.1 EAL domain-containing protein [Rhizobium sp. BC49]PDS84148.1 diguanylate cyclase [Rhizobium sp. L18]TBY47621.1 EAL domain-containing protein [Rhizobium leguminosarum bv. viciae]